MNMIRRGMLKYRLSQKKLRAVKLRNYCLRRIRQWKTKETVKHLIAIEEVGQVFTNNLTVFTEVIGYLKGNQIPYEYLDGGKEWRFAIRRTDKKEDNKVKVLKQPWNKKEDIILLTEVEKSTGMGNSMSKAMEEVSKVLGRSKSGCFNRYYVLKRNGKTDALAEHVATSKDEGRSHMSYNMAQTFTEFVEYVHTLENKVKSYEAKEAESNREITDLRQQLRELEEMKNDYEELVLLFRETRRKILGEDKVGVKLYMEQNGNLELVK